MAHFDQLLRCNPLAIRHDLVWYSPDQPMPARVMSPSRWVSSVLNTFVDLQQMFVKHESLVDRMKRVRGSHETLLGTEPLVGAMDLVLDHWSVVVNTGRSTGSLEGETRRKWITRRSTGSLDDYWITEQSTGSLNVVSGTLRAAVIALVVKFLWTQEVSCLFLSV